MILITLCVTTFLLIFKSGFEDEPCDLFSNNEFSHLRHLITKKEKSLFCETTAIKSLAGGKVQNALDFLTKQTNELLIKTKILDTSSPQGVVRNNIILIN